jgi:hypothetical protein
MPQINTKLPSEKPFLVIAAKPFEEQKHLPLFKTATKFFENDRFVLFELDFKKFEKIIKKEQRQRQQQFNLREKELFLTEEKIWADVPTKAILFENFDTKSKKKYEGFGNKHVFFDGFLPKDSIGQPLEISLWVNIDNALPSVPLLKCEIYDKNNSLIERKEVLGNLQTQVRGTWLRIPLNLTATEHRYKLYLGYYNDFTLFHCEADNFLIRPTNVNVWQQTGKKMGFSYNGWIEN